MILDAVACKIQSVALYEDLLKALKNNEVISLINYVKEEELSHLQALKSLKKNYRDRSVL
jgi:rubrerythrin